MSVRLKKPPQIRRNSGNFREFEISLDCEINKKICFWWLNKQKFSNSIQALRNKYVVAQGIRRKNNQNMPNFWQVSGV